MTRVVSAIVFSVAVATWLILSAAAPWVLSDNNEFLRGFVNHELLSFMGVLVTISLASAASLHLELNKFEETAGQSVFVKSRERIRQSAVMLIAALVFSIVLVVVKPLGDDTVYAQSLFNGAALLALLASVLVLSDLTRTVFKLGPRLKE